MATTLWIASVAGLEGARADLELIAVHPDSGRFKASAPFVLRLLYEHANDVAPDLSYIPKGPLGALDIDEVHSEEWVTLQAPNYIAEVRVELRDSDAMDEREARRKVASTLVSAGLRQDEKRWKPAFEAEWRRLWSDVGALPRARYRVTATDSKWLAHLAVGDRWRSAAWDPSS